MVSAASRMFSAISFGVFCRFAPSTRAIIRSMKLSPGFWVISTTIRSDSTLVPPVTADRSPPDSRITGADSPVMADSSTLAMPSTTSPSPGITSPASTTTTSPCCSAGPPRPTPRFRAFGAGLPAAEPPGHGVLLGPAQGVGLGLAPALGHRLGQVGEDHGQPEPDGDQPGEHGRVPDRQDRGEHRADLDDEHHRVAPQRGRVQLAHGGRDGRQELLGVQQPAGDPARLARLRGLTGRWPLHGCGGHQCRPSASGPSARAGR